MSEDLLKTVRKGFFPGILVTVTFVIALVTYYLGANIGIKGAYVLVGVTIGAGMMRVLRKQTEQTKHVHLKIRGHQLQKALWALLLLAVSYTILTSDRLLVLLFVLPIGYGLLCAQFYFEVDSPRRILAQATALFILSPLTKFLATGYYYANTDNIYHLLRAKNILITGTSLNLTGYYQVFPNLHILTAVLKYITGVALYDVSIPLLIIAFCWIPSLVFLIAQYLTQNSEYSLFVAVGVTLLAPLSLYATYYWAQGLAVVLVLYLLMVAFYMKESNRGLSDPNNVRWVVISVVLALAIVFTHHLTVLIYMPILVLLYLLPALISRVVSPREKPLNPRLFPLILTGILAVLHWTLLKTKGESFISLIFFVGSGIIAGGLRKGLSQSGGQGNVYSFGTTLREETLLSAFLDFGLPSFVYYAMLLAVFLIGVITVLERYTEYDRSLHVVLLGMAAAVVVFKTPLTVKLLPRVQFAMSFFFAFVLGSGLYRMRNRGQLPSPGATSYAVLLGAIVVLGTTAPLVAADDMTFIHDSETAITSEERVQLENMGRFVNQHGGGQTVTGFYNRKMTLRLFSDRPSVEDQFEARPIDDGRLRMDEGLFLYSYGFTSTETKIVSRWPQPYLSYGIITKPWLEQTVGRENKVYTTGGTGLLWSQQQQTLGRAEQ